MRYPWVFLTKACPTQFIKTLGSCVNLWERGNMSPLNSKFVVPAFCSVTAVNYLVTTVFLIVRNASKECKSGPTDSEK